MLMGFLAVAFSIIAKDSHEKPNSPSLGLCATDLHKLRFRCNEFANIATYYVTNPKRG